MIISFSGLDGSGKTTESKKLAEELNGKYYHIGNLTIFGNISQFLQKRNPRLHNNIRDLEYMQNKSIKKSIVSFIKKITSLMDLFYFRIFRAWNWNKIIIIDRYFYDILVQAQYFKFFGYKFSRLYLKLIPRADVSYFLNVGLETAFKRADKSKHQDLNFFKKKERLYYGVIGEK